MVYSLAVAAPNADSTLATEGLVTAERTRPTTGAAVAFARVVEISNIDVVEQHATTLNTGRAVAAVPAVTVQATVASVFFPVPRIRVIAVLDELGRVGASGLGPGDIERTGNTGRLAAVVTRFAETIVGRRLLGARLVRQVECVPLAVRVDRGIRMVAV